jgi:hypothetical protein
MFVIQRLQIREWCNSFKLRPTDLTDTKPLIIMTASKKKRQLHK